MRAPKKERAEIKTEIVTKQNGDNKMAKTPPRRVGVRNQNSVRVLNETTHYTPAHANLQLTVIYSSTM